VPPSPARRFGGLVGDSVVMREVFALLDRISPTEATLLVVGETGSGKGALARSVHTQSKRNQGPFLLVDCGAISESLIESELFGHERGSFTGAERQRIGFLEAASGGTLFLDEIDDLPLELQPKLLRALEDRVFQRVGSSTPIKFDARIIASSKKDLWALVQQGRFREDLFFRLSVFTVHLPPLRERREDLPSLADALVGEGVWSKLPQELREQFLAHSWPGNVRELRNALERAGHLAELPGGVTPEQVLQQRAPPTPPALAALGWPPASPSPFPAVPAASAFAAPQPHVSKYATPPSPPVYGPQPSAPPFAATAAPASFPPGPGSYGAAASAAYPVPAPTPPPPFPAPAPASPFPAAPAPFPPVGAPFPAPQPQVRERTPSGGRMPTATQTSDLLPVDYAADFKRAKDQLVAAFEREYLARLLHRTGGNVAAAARIAGIDRKHFAALLRKHSLIGRH
jgi:DNA-binding NtrC family response regulator